MALLNGYSEAAAIALQDALMGKTGYTAPGQFKVVLSRSDINTNDTVASIDRPVAAGYTDVTTVPTDWTDAAGVDAALSNAALVEFPQSTGSWGLITYVAVTAIIAVPAIGEIILWGGPLTTPKTIETDTVAVFTIGSLVIKSQSS